MLCSVPPAWVTWGANYGTTEPEWSTAGGVGVHPETARRVRAAARDRQRTRQLIGNRPVLGSRRTEAEAVLTAALGATGQPLGTTTRARLTAVAEGVAPSPSPGQPTRLIGPTEPSWSGTSRPGALKVLQALIGLLL